LHELAHVRRYDHVVNLVQQAAECLLFFNPGFLWISYLIREERENCCDDAAIGCTQDRVEFVRALVRFKEHSLRGTALAFPGNRRQLLNRVLRISRRENKTLSGRERLILLGGCIVLVGMFAMRVEREAGKPAGLPDAAVIQKEKEQKTQAVRPVSPELVAVLRTRQQVAQNMEWVQGQLEQLHHQGKTRQHTNGKNKPEEMRKEEEVVINPEDQVTALEQPQQDQQTEAQRSQQAQVQQSPDEVQQREQAERDRRQADLDREQAERDRQQAARDREQAERDRQEAMRDREQAERDRAQADLNRKQAQLDRQKHKVIDQHQ
jgi:hypothetical protein